MAALAGSLNLCADLRRDELRTFIAAVNLLGTLPDVLHAVVSISWETPCNELLQHTQNYVHSEVDILEMLGHINGATNNVHTKEDCQHRPIIWQGHTYT